MPTSTNPMIQSPADPPVMPVSRIARFSIEQYDRMIAAGVFETGLKRQRLELIHGEIRDMSPIGPPHENVLGNLNEWSIDNAPRESVSVRIQCSITLPTSTTIPEPDVAWVKRKLYHVARPNADDAFLIIEVANSSLDYDTGEKADLYASASIDDYWVVNVQNKCIEIRREPSNGRYRTLHTFDQGETIQPLLFPNAELAVATLFVDERKS